jgi:hypothetical protein
MNFKAQETALKAAGFTFDGEAVRDALGNAVAGVGAYGDVWCKSAEVEAIMSRPAPKPVKKEEIVVPFTPKEEAEE